MEEKMSVMDIVKRYWMWIGAGVVVLIFLARGRGGATVQYPVPAPAGVPDQTMLEVAEKEIKLRSLQLEHQAAEQALKRESAIEELYTKLLSKELEREIVTQERLLEKARMVPIRCPTGKTRMSPSGELYCREEQHKGGPSGLFRRLEETLRRYVTYPGTPPIVPWS